MTHAFQHTNRPLIVIKLGGNVLQRLDVDSRSFVEDIEALKQSGARIVCVHGAGPAIDKALADAGIVPAKINGLRVTDQQTLPVVVRVLDAANFALASMLPDAEPFPSARSPLRATKSATDVDLGLVGEVEAVDTDPLFLSLSGGKIPVIAPVGHDKNGGLLNINADHAAVAVAAALSATSLVFLSDVPGVLADPSDPSSIVADLHVEKCQSLIASGTISGGMIPKVKTAISAIELGVKSVVITDGARRHGVMDACLSRSSVSGTTLRR
jgi:acetylglutamate kinase